MLFVTAAAAARIGSPLLGVIIPAAVFGLSFWVAYSLFRRFTRRTDGGNEGEH